MVNVCPEDNTEAIDQSSFWDENGLHWDYHRIGWAISGGCALITLIITIFSVLGHARHYYVRSEQRQIIRILYMPPVFAIISFFSYRFFRSYTYYSLVEVIYESFVLSAFLLLIIQYVAQTAASRTAEDALARKDKTKLPIPCCCLRYRPTKPYFMYTLKWSVMQYTIIRPACSIAGIITQYYGVLCESELSPHFAAVYIEAVDFVSISVALMGLIVFYDLTKDELRGRRPLAKFLCIKLIVMVTWYQSFVFSMLQDKKIIKATDFWTTTNIADGLNALATCIEMVLFAIFMWWAYPSSEYRNKESSASKEGGYILAGGDMTDDEKARRKHPTTSIWRPLWDSINFSDFAVEIWSSFVFFWDYIRGKPHAHSHRPDDRATFGEAFGVDDTPPRRKLAKARSGKDQSKIGRDLPTNDAGSFSNGGGSVFGRDTYPMISITAQPRPQEPPSRSLQPQGSQHQSPQHLSAQANQQDNVRWSTVGMAL
ncbi:hypothetical protein FS842_008317 [Serendipita sp. 407]|nr:hypothetical protein FRC18_009862 [Serendipita sp. 400]KAG9053353.1 hypothetical protein FS842_008317 [Serendipita sp. 407]